MNIEFKPTLASMSIEKLRELKTKYTHLAHSATTSETFDLYDSMKYKIEVELENRGERI